MRHVEIPKQQQDALTQLLKTFGPYRREQLRKQLLAAAEASRDDAAHAASIPHAWTSPLVPQTAAGWSHRAAIFERMAEIVRTAPLPSHL